MIEDDTIKLLDECDAGIKMAVTSFNEVMDSIKDERLKKTMEENKQKHTELGNRTHELLNKYHDEGKEPNPVAKAMSWMKINMKLSMDNSDREVADLIFDGCNMGVKSLYRYLNQYKAANEEAKNLVKETIKTEDDLRAQLVHYL